MTPTPDQLRSMYETMLRIRRCDERFRSLIGAGQIFLVYYSPAGQEAISAGLCAHLRDEDQLVTIYRGLHDMIAKGVPLDLLWAEFAGRQAGTCGGKGGPMHITFPEKGAMVTTGIVGAGLPITNGFALANQLLGEDRVAVTCFGDGASNIGAFHEALNLAAVWQLPSVFVCQNNGYAEHTPYAEGTSVARVSERGAAYGMPAVTVDGNDPVAVFEAAGEAVERARAGGGPTLIEAITYRFFGHVNGDAMEYMPKEELAAAKEADPLAAFEARLLADGVLSPEAVDATAASIGAELDAAVAFALASPPPDPSALLTDVYAQELS